MNGIADYLLPNDEDLPDSSYLDPQEVTLEDALVAEGIIPRPTRTPPKKKATKAKTPPKDKPEPKPWEIQPGKLTHEQVAEKLRESHRAGISGADLPLLVISLSEQTGIYPSELRKISDDIAAEVQRESIADKEAVRMAAEADRQEIAGAITLTSMLPQTLAEAIRTRCEWMPYDPILLTITFLTTMSGLTKLGTKVIGNRGTRFIVPTNLFTAVVAETGRKKTPLIAAMVTEPTAIIRKELEDHHTRAMAEWRTSCKGVKRDDRPPPPVQAHAVVNDYTGEALASLLQEHERLGYAALVLRDELAGLFGSLNAYRPGADEQMLLELFDGGAYTSLRVRGDRSYSRSHLSIFGNIQPAVLSGLVGGKDSSGKWARFIFCPLRDKITPLPTEISQDQEDEITEAISYLQTIAKKVYCLAPAEYQLEPAAVMSLSAFDAMQQQQNQTAELETIQALHGKSAGKVLRVAGLLHILQRVCNQQEGDCLTIRLDTLQKAIVLVDMLNQWAAGFHADAAAEAMGGITNLMKRVHNASAHKGNSWICWRVFSRSLSQKQQRQITRQAFEQVVGHLSVGATDNSRQTDMRWGEKRQKDRGGIEYRAIRAPI
jgi:hypothetical protein